jgi:hypothetical protein
VGYSQNIYESIEKQHVSSAGLNYGTVFLYLYKLKILIMRVAGIVLFIIGIVTTLIFGIQAIQESETFSFLGIDIGVSSANWTPLIISVIVLVIGLVMMNSGRRRSRI